MIHDLNEKFNNNLWDSLRVELNDSLRHSLGDRLKDSIWDSLGYSLRDSFWNNFGLRDNIKDILKRCVTDAQNVEKTNDE